MKLSACDNPDVRAQTRLIAALGASALIHSCVPMLIGGGPAGSSRVSAPPPVLEVRVTPARIEASPEPVAVVERPLPSPEPRAMAVPRTARAPVSADDKSDQRPTGSSVTDTPDLTYYGARQLDVYPSLASELDLNAGESGVSGSALLLVLIDATGAVHDVSVVEAELPRHFEAEAKRAFLAARFTPAYRNGRAVRSRLLVQVNYGGERPPR